MTAELLRKAADRIEGLAAEATTTHGDWHADHTLPDETPQSDQACVMVITNSEENWAQVLFMADWGTDADADWIATLNPLIAAPLAAWLRTTADADEARIVLRTPSFGTFEAAVALARAVLGFPLPSE